MSNKNLRYTPNAEIENQFRLQVRNALDLDLFSRDDQIIAEIERLKNLERQVAAQCPR